MCATQVVLWRAVAMVRVVVYRVEPLAPQLGGASPPASSPVEALVPLVAFLALLCAQALRHSVRNAGRRGRPPPAQVMPVEAQTAGAGQARERRGAN